MKLVSQRRSMGRPASVVTSAFALAVVACSSSSPTSTSSTAKDAGRDAARDAVASDATASDVGPGVPDVHPDAINDPKNCVAPGATSSEKGVGGYCSPGAGQCVHAGTGGTATLCSADFGAPSHEWFCTITCTTTADCGPGGGTCLSAPFAQICVPASCAGALGDASSSVVDSGSGDAGDAEAAHDAATHHDAAVDAPTTSHDASHDSSSKADAEEDAHKASDGSAG
jgi:hypothetical protein